MIQVTLPDGQIVGTGLQFPTNAKENTSLDVYEASGPMLTKTEIIKAAKSGEFDGRKKFDVSWVKNQRIHGSCNGFSEASALSKARVRRGLKRVDLSGAYAYSLINGGMDRGSQLESGMIKAQSVGIATEKTVPWDKIYPHLYDSEKANKEASQYKAFECYAVNTWLGLLSALAAGFDVVTAVHVGGNFMRVSGDAAIAGVDYGPGNHAISVDGLIWAGEVVPTAQNSWGTSYGVNGRMQLMEAHFSEPSRYHMSYAIRSTTDSEEDTNEMPTVEV